jgi:hypothetical protein
MSRPLLLSFAVALTMVVTVMPAEAQPHGAPVDYHRFAELGGLRLDRPTGTRSHLGRTYEYREWTSAIRRPGFDATQLIASWNARTPEGTWLQVEAQGWTDAGTSTAWYVMGQWASSDATVRRTSVPDQDDANATVDVDTLTMKPGVTLRSYRLRIGLYREAGSHLTPLVTQVGAMTSNIPDRFDVPASRPGPAAGRELPVPAYAQNLHKGHFPEYGGGGENWCSPTSTEMVIEYWGRRPREADLAWVPADYPDRTVEYAARHTYDYSYEGTGNWPFNTAYAAEFGLRGHITRLRSLTDLENYIAQGIPVITSQSFLASELDGAGYGTAGHLMVVVGFTREGDVIAHDPAADSNDRVRTIYRRDQFEKIWLRTKRYTESGGIASGSGGVVYLITP